MGGDVEKQVAFSIAPPSRGNGTGLGGGCGDALLQAAKVRDSGSRLGDLPAGRL